MTDRTLFDRAYAYHKEGANAHRAESLAKLAVEFPQSSSEAIESAFDAAGELVDAACRWADEKRGPKNDGTGEPTFSLQDCCPGFSEGVYSNAESWGLYLTK
jgi:hypothetical protein